uniref:Putative ubiquitin-conjugating enzyme e2 o-like isoform x1 n=1 Tax=Triatoma dimidiata TaxID=72491 RepID=A0A0V0G6I3_TRIDM
MAAEHQYFYEDEVYRVNKKGNIEFGMVLENSELVSSDDDSDNEEGVKMKKGHIRVAWHPTGTEEVVSEKKVGLADRSLMPGDVVRRMIKGKDTQRGYCRHMEVTACIQVVGTKHIINHINSKDLVPIEELGPDIAVCLDSWVGGIKLAHTKLILRLADNTRCVVLDPDSIGFEVFDEKKDSDAEFSHRGDYYPGQTLWGPLNVLDDIAEWIEPKEPIRPTVKNKSSGHKIIKVIVEDVQVDSVAVHWQCRAYSKEGAGSDKEQPKVLIQGEDLKRLKLLTVFEPCTLQVGDRSIYTLKENDIVTTKEQWRKEQKRIILKDGQGFKAKRKRQGSNFNKVGNGPKNKLEIENGHMEQIKNVENMNMQLDDITLDNNKDLDTREEEESSEYDTDTMSNATSSSASGVSSSFNKKHASLPIRALTKALHKKKLRRSAQKKVVTPVKLVPGNKVIVETVSTMSTADVVWQDGSVEKGIPSTELYPIHHLDDQEFFPGDFVIENREEGCIRVYGVVQRVDHAGRTATVKWFRTYTADNVDCPQPALLMENEVSVYDLKDHPDFQYRPGTVVIRVANFQGEDEGCTAGQVLDNYPEGRVRVWWVEGHISMCWPQDLYRVGEYDSDEGELWDDGTSDEGSWQTESEELGTSDEHCLDETHDENLKPKLAANIEKARIAMSRLEEIFTQNPSLQTTEVMRKLLEVYKDCRYLDKLMGTAFFHERHFEGLLERVRERGRTNLAQRVADQVHRLFTHTESNEQLQDQSLTNSIVGDDKIAANNPNTTITEETGDEKSIRDAAGEFLTGSLASLEARVSAKVQENVSIDLNEDTSLSVQDQKATTGTVAFNINPNVHHLSNGQSKSNTQPDYSNQQPSCNQGHVCAANVCVRLCSLLLGQLVKAHAEVIRRFGGNSGSMSEAANSVSPNAKEPGKGTNEEIINTKNNAESQPNQTHNSNEVNGTIDSNEDSIPILSEKGIFTIVDTAPNSHKYKLTMFQPTDTKQFFRRVREEIKLLKNSLPAGIWVTGFEDRMDLFSVMIRGPAKTPYEDGLFFFDFQLSADYPKTPPHCHYVSYCSDRLNPNLYEDGKVCVSLLGTWSGKGTEVWTYTSNLLQVIVSIQGLILVNEPYFNEAGYEKQKGSQQGRENSRMYNEMVVLKLVQAMTKLVVNPPPVFKDEINQHFNQHANKLCERLESWLDLSENYNNAHPLSPTTPTTYKQLQDMHTDGVSLPEFPLIPASKGFCITLRKTLVNFKNVLATQQHHYQQQQPDNNSASSTS